MPNQDAQNEEMKHDAGASELLRETQPMTITMIKDDVAMQVLKARAVNLRLLKDEYNKFLKKYPGKFIVIANGEVVKECSSRREAKKFVSSLPESDRIGAVVEFINSPLQVFTTI